MQIVFTALIVDVHGEDYIFTWNYGEDSKVKLKFTLGNPFTDQIGDREATVS